MKYAATLILMIFITGCAPYLTYEEMEDAYELAETQEEKDSALKVLVNFEENAEKARLYFDSKLTCVANTDLTWYCDNAHSVKERRIKDLDGLVRAYKREHHDCGCVSIDRLMDALNYGY